MNKVDLLGQYIALVLIPRINKADELIYQKRYYDAVKRQLSVIRVLYRDSAHERKSLQAWIQRIEDIDEKSREIKGLERNLEGYNKNSFRNMMAKELYKELDMEIWDRLHALGYFSGRKAYGPNMKDIDFSRAEVVG